MGRISLEKAGDKKTVVKVIKGSSGGKGSDEDDGEGVGDGEIGGRARVRIEMKRVGRPRTPGQNPADAVGKKGISRKSKVSVSTPDASASVSAPPSTPAPTSVIVRRRRTSSNGSIREDTSNVIGIDRYLDADAIAAERAKRYRPEDFHVAVKNEHDHDEKIIVRIHPLMKAAMEEMVDSKHFPISSTQDILRVGALELMRKLHHLRKSTPRETHWMSQLEAISRIVFSSEQTRLFQRSLDSLKDEIDKLRQFGPHGMRQAAKLVMTVKQAVNRIDDKAWGRWYQQEIEREFGSIVRANQKRVKVKTVAGEDD